MHRIGRISLAIILSLAVALLSAWSGLAMWYRLPSAELGRAAACAILISFGIGTVMALFSRFRFRAVVLFIAAFAAVLVWWSTIKPLDDAEWAPDVARQVTGTLDGNLLTLKDVRDFEWRSDIDFAEHWTTRTYDLSTVQTADLFMSYWAGPKMAHVMMSFGFSDGRYLAWSIEVRRRVGGKFSPIADLFKSNPLVIIAADERDVIGVRSNVRGEDVQIYRLKASPDAARSLLLEYVSDGNALSTKPAFYNSITTNCTTTIVKMMRAVGDPIPFDWRLIVNGYLPEYAYDRGALDTRLPISTLREFAHIDDRARKSGLSPDFSRLIRVGVPYPHREYRFRKGIADGPKRQGGCLVELALVVSWSSSSCFFASPRRSARASGREIESMAADHV
ncbi:membrane protein [Mesorhizobium sp. L103C119B0]|nr:membrane protein [Mesorhizobium sp. L103C119B0]